MTMTTYDYIIIGAGSAGCALAGRLADAQPGSIALLEAGGHDQKRVITLPIGFAATVPKAGPFNYGYQTEPQPGLNGRQIFQPRGRGLGGSSSINAMVYIRGVPSDYDHWAELGCAGWSWQDVLPYFKRSEANIRLAGHAETQLHGGVGPLKVADTRSTNPFDRRFIEATLAAGYPYNDDFNGSTQEGVGFYQRTQLNGERWNAARAYLHGGAMPLNGGRSNLQVLTDSQVLRILFEGKRAVGVEHMHNGQRQVLRARREVILSAGSYGSPQLLMVSGVGPAEHLAEHGIELVQDLPEVGQNLQEHPDARLHMRLFSTDLYAASVPGGLRMLGEWQRYRRDRYGMFASNIVETGAFLKSRAELPDPDLQLHFGTSFGDLQKLGTHGYNGHVCVLRPHSRGELRLASADAREAPLINPNLLGDPRDLEAMLTGVHLVKRILDQPQLASLGGKAHFHAHLKFDGSDDEAVKQMIRERTETAFHPVGTCRMGADRESVVDPQLRVRGIDGLRVVDVSIMPKLIGGNTNAPAMMIGEKACDLLLQEQQQ
ncbi:FAD-dependent oxidoreductase [Pseudomonas sp. LS44]|uniref:GMC family oxidoreductase n=1 Tax=Pseudomonas sp. LS44 TaxID=1357074 RepID=UPI00215B4C9C|nr:GMC family oxidoreductase N-terminal domain-containing protein [Pseudomonas sp. LS44]UVE19555.1 FAD-dependent oxidoreductase [Pseudomonas sp. LS44]